MNFKKLTRFQSIKASAKLSLKKNIGTCGNKRIYRGKEGYMRLNEVFHADKKSIVKLTHYEARLIYEYLRHLGSNRYDFTKKVYFPSDFRVNSTIGVMSKKSLEHVASELLKTLETADVICLSNIKKEEYLLIKSFPNNDATFVVLDGGMIENTPLLEFLDGKKVLAVSPYDELIKVQHLHQYLFHKNISKAEGKFELLTLPLDTIYQEKSAYAMFDKLDALKIEILKYDFDVALINLSILSTPIAYAIKSLGKKVICMDEELLTLFGIAKDSAEKSQHDSYWVDLSSYNSGSEKTFLVTGVIGAPINVKKRRKK